MTSPRCSHETGLCDVPSTSQPKKKLVSELTADALEQGMEKRWARIVARTWDDEEFRQRLLANPGAVLREAGFDLPDDLEVEVVDRVPDEHSEGVTCVQLPGCPEADDIIEQGLSAPADDNSNES
jgi:nitrile hydratase